MAAVTAASSLVVANPVADLQSSGSAFRTAGSPVQHVSLAPLRLKSSCGRVAAARASVSDEPQKFSIRREIVASIVAAGAVLSSTSPVLADPVADAKRNVEAAVENVEGSAGKASSQVRGSIDGIFGKNKAPPFKFNGVNRATEALRGAKNSVGSAGAEKAEKDVQSVASAPNLTGDLVPDRSPSSGDAGKAADSAGSTIQEKGSKAVDEGQNFVGQAPGLTDATSAIKEAGDNAISDAQGLGGQATTDFLEARSLPSLFPKSGEELTVKVATEAVKTAADAASN